MQITTIYPAASRSETGETKPIGGGLLNGFLAIYRMFTYIFWKAAIVSRPIIKLTRFIGNYRHYRGKGFNTKSSWYLASMTLP
jgi:hypothetical protein